MTATNNNHLPLEDAEERRIAYNARKRDYYQRNREKVQKYQREYAYRKSHPLVNTDLPHIVQNRSVTNQSISLKDQIYFQLDASMQQSGQPSWWISRDDLNRADALTRLDVILRFFDSKCTELNNYLLINTLPPSERLAMLNTQMFYSLMKNNLATLIQAINYENLARLI